MPYESITDFIAQMPTRDRLLRGGIIPYITTEIGGLSQTFYCLGLDYSSGNITDFAGKREAKDRSIIDTSIREFQEETLRVFGPIYREDLIERGATAISDHQSVTILVPFPELKLGEPVGRETRGRGMKTREFRGLDAGIDMMKIVDDYTRSTRSLRKEPELSMLIWMNDHQLRMALTQNKREPTIFYYPTGRLLSQIFSDEEMDQCNPEQVE